MKWPSIENEHYELVTISNALVKLIFSTDLYSNGVLGSCHPSPTALKA